VTCGSPSRPDRFSLLRLCKDRLRFRPAGVQSLIARGYHETRTLNNADAIENSELAILKYFKANCLRGQEIDCKNGVEFYPRRRPITRGTREMLEGIPTINRAQLRTWGALGQITL
jgi:hypothetical protein